MGSHALLQVSLAKLHLTFTLYSSPCQSLVLKVVPVPLQVLALFTCFVPVHSTV